MEGEGSVRDAAVASLKEMGGLTQPDVVEELGGHHGSAVGGSAVLGTLVAAAPDEEDMVDATVGEAEGVDLDVHVGPVKDLVVQPLHVEMEADFGFPDEEVDLKGDEEYFSGSDVDIERWTYKSFVKKEEKKLRKEGLDAYMPFDDEFYRCKYHHNKPANGLRVVLVEHVRAVALRSFDSEGHFDLRDMGKHEALLRMLGPDEFEYVESEDEELEE